MTPQIHSRTRDPRGPTTTTWLLAIAIQSSLGCDAVTTRETAAALSTSSTQTFVARPRQRFVFTATPHAPAAEVEAFYKANILPAIIGDRRIGDVAITVDRDGRYLVELEIRSATEANMGFAIDVLSAGKSAAEGARIFEQFAAYFDIDRASQLAPRADLSIARTIVGTVAGGTP